MHIGRMTIVVGTSGERTIVSTGMWKCATLIEVNHRTVGCLGVALIVVAQTLLSGEASAQTGTEVANRAGAKLHFDRGLEEAHDGNLDVAVAEFEKSLAFQSHPTVLFNLGEAYAALGRPVEAVDRLT